MSEEYLCEKQVQVCLCITSDANASRVNVHSLNKLLSWDAACNRRSLSAISRLWFFVFFCCCFSRSSRDSGLEPEETDSSALPSQPISCAQSRSSWAKVSHLRYFAGDRQTGRAQTAQVTGLVSVVLWFVKARHCPFGMKKKWNLYTARWLHIYNSGSSLESYFSESLKCLKGISPAGKLYL